MVDADGVDLVLRRLSKVVGCDPQSVGSDTWQVTCPVHGGPYPALLVSRGGDGSVSLKCRYVNMKGEFCSEAEIWESLGLQPRQFERALAATAAIDRSGEPGAQPSAAVNGHSEAPVRQEAAELTESPSPADHDAAPTPRCDAQPPALTVDVSLIAPPMPQPEPCGVGEAAVRAAQPGDRPEAAAADDDAAAAVPSRQPTIAGKTPRRSARASAAIPNRSGRDSGSHAGMFRSLARQVRLVRGLDHRFYAQVSVAGHQEILELRSLPFHHWVTLNYLRRRLPPPGRDRINNLIRTFEAEAAALGFAEAVWVRVADGRGRTGRLAGRSPRPCRCTCPLQPGRGHRVLSRPGQFVAAERGNPGRWVPHRRSRTRALPAAWRPWSAA